MVVLNRVANIVLRERKSKMKLYKFNMYGKLIFSIMMILTLSGCASRDFNLTKFRPSGQDEQYSYYIYESFADAVYPEDSNSAEAQRIKWLKQWINENELPMDKYEIVSRKAIKKSVGLLGEIYDIYYEVKIQKKI